MPLADSLDIVSDTVKKNERSPGEVEIKIKKKVEQILNKNLDIKRLKAIVNIHNSSDMKTAFEFNITEWRVYKFVYITSTDAERSFSRYKNVLSPNRRWFTFENLKEDMIIDCFVDDEDPNFYE